MPVDVPQRFEAPPWFRRAAVGLAATLVLLELGVAAIACAMAALVPTCAPPATHTLLRLFWAALAVQGVAVLGFAAAVYGMARTAVDHEGDRLSLRSPWRTWRGAAGAVTRAYLHRDVLALEIDGRWWRPWRVRLARHDAAALAALRDRLGAGVWLEGARLRAHLLRRLVPAVVVLLVLGAAAHRAVEGLTERVAVASADGAVDGPCTAGAPAR